MQEHKIHAHPQHSLKHTNRSIMYDGMCICGAHTPCLCAICNAPLNVAKRGMRAAVCWGVDASGRQPQFGAGVSGGCSVAWWWWFWGGSLVRSLIKFGYAQWLAIKLPLAHRRVQRGLYMLAPDDARWRWQQREHCTSAHGSCCVNVLYCVLAVSVLCVRLFGADLAAAPNCL